MVFSIQKAQVIMRFFGAMPPRMTEGKERGVAWKRKN